jgi:formamidopyrimidine-DNA glycosylase
VLVVPELPEVETVRRGLQPLVTGRSVVDAWGHPSPKFAGAVDAVGAAVTGVGRRGKYLLLALEPVDLDPVDGGPAGLDLVIHLGMTGQLRVEPAPPDAPADAAAKPGGAHDRAWWAFDDGTRLVLRDVRRFGRVAVVGSDRAALPTLAALGPEPFDPAFTPAHLWAALGRSTARVKTQLLSQRPVAGVGNIYADEALWQARIHPGARSVSRPAAARLHAALVEVLEQGVRNGGTTLRDYRTVAGGSGANQHELACYGRAGAPCLRCGTTLRRSVLDGRGTTHCPTCQRR